MPGDTASSLWSFACDFYQMEGVQPSLLWLQDHRGIDVPFLLFTLWTGIRGVELTSGETADYLDFAGGFSNNLVGPVRQSRRWLRAQEPQSPELYQQLLDTELACEKLLLEALESRFGRERQSVDSASSPCVTNTKLYLATAGIECDVEAREKLAVLFNRLDQRAHTHLTR